MPDAAEEEADEPNDDSRLPTSYRKDGPAVEISRCKAIVVDASVRRGYHVVGRAAARVPA
jgi:hypothetical protein